MMFNLKYSTVFYDPQNPAAAQQVSSAMINSMRQHSANVASGDAGEGGPQGGDEPGVGGVFDSSQVPTPWPGQQDQTKAGEGLGGNPLPNNFDGPRDPGVLPAIVELENANPLKDITGGAFDTVMHAFQEAINFAKASIFRFINGTKMVGWLFGSLLRGFFKLFKEFRNYLFTVGSTVISEFNQMIARWFNLSLSSEKEDEEAKSASMKQHADEEQRTLHGDQAQHRESEGRKQVDELLTPMNREELNNLRVNQAYESDTGRFSPPFGRNDGQRSFFNLSNDELEQQRDHPFRPRTEELRRKRLQALVGSHIYIN
jgi:hypothetical protein